MLQYINTTEAPAYVYNGQPLTVEYGFSEYKPAYLEMSTSKLWLDILFVHPQTNEAVSIRIAKTTLILCQPKEVIEAVVHRAIRNFLQQSQVKEYGMAAIQMETAPVLS